MDTTTDTPALWYGFDPQGNLVKRMFVVVKKGVNMGIKDLSASERDIAFACLRFILESNALEDDMHPRTGLDYEDLATIIAKWPNLEDDKSQHADFLAVNNCFAAVSSGLIISEKDWQKWFSVTDEAVRQAFQQWRRTVGTPTF